MSEAYITTKGGNLVAECEGMELYLSDAGIDCFGFGDSIELPETPEDIWHLAEMLQELQDIVLEVLYGIETVTF